MAGIDDYTVLCLHFDGPDGSTDVRDCAGRHSPTVAGTAVIDTAQSKFGGSSLWMDGNSDFATIADSADWAMGTGDFTVDLWARFDDIAANRALWDQMVTTANRWGAYYDPVAKKLLFRVTASNIVTVEVLGSADLAADTWYHLALERASNAYTWYADGTGCAMSGTPDADTIADLAAPLRVGRYNTAYMLGWIDEFRISKGLARYGGTFTPPTEPYDSPAYVVPLGRQVSPIDKVPPHAIVW